MKERWFDSLVLVLAQLKGLHDLGDLFAFSIRYLDWRELCSTLSLSHLSLLQISCGFDVQNLKLQQKRKDVLKLILREALENIRRLSWMRMFILYLYSTVSCMLLIIQSNLAIITRMLALAAAQSKSYFINS